MIVDCIEVNNKIRSYYGLMALEVGESTASDQLSNQTRTNANVVIEKFTSCFTMDKRTRKFTDEFEKRVEFFSHSPCNGPHGRSVKLS